MEDVEAQAALEAALLRAAAAFASARLTRRLLDQPGVRGAATVVSAEPVRGARRASRKAQAKLEEAARCLEESRDRWAALMRGLAVDLERDPESLVDLVEELALRQSIEQAETTLSAAADSAAQLGTGAPPELSGALNQLRQYLRSRAAAENGHAQPE